jgi:hypothetical protein
LNPYRREEVERTREEGDKEEQLLVDWNPTDSRAAETITHWGTLPATHTHTDALSLAPGGGSAWR